MTTTATSLSVESAEASPATTAALAHIDQIFRRALSRSTFGASGDVTDAGIFGIVWWSLDDYIAFATMLFVFLIIFLLALGFKLILGMLLLRMARNRYKTMKEREKLVVDVQGKRVGGWGSVEVDDEKRRWIYAEDPEGLRNLRKKESQAREKGKKGEMDLDGVDRYSMVAKRIW